MALYLRQKQVIEMIFKGEVRCLGRKHSVKIRTHINIREALSFPTGKFGELLLITARKMRQGYKAACRRYRRHTVFCLL